MTRAARTGGESPDDSVLERWSRRKRDATVAPAVEPAGGPPEPVIDAAVASIELTDVDMPPVDGLGAASDYSPFMSPGVSDALRRLALRKLFHSPVFNLRDGLDDYDGNYRAFTALGDTVTADMKHRLALREALAAETPPDDLPAPRLADRAEDVADAVAEDVADADAVAEVPALIESDETGDVEPPDADRGVT